eukprot:2890660-Pyramimonas_sp.AAC.1
MASARVSAATGHVQQSLAQLANLLGSRLRGALLLDSASRADAHSTAALQRRPQRLQAPERPRDAPAQALACGAEGLQPGIHGREIRSALGRNQPQ